MIYNIDFDISAVAISLLTIFYIIDKKGLQNRANRTYFVIVVSGLLSAVADIFSCIINANPNVNNYLLQDMWNYIYLYVHNLVPYLLVLYILQITGKTLSRKLHFLLVLPVLADYLLLIINPFKKWVFYYDMDGSYYHGRGFNIIYTGAVIYLFIMLFLLMSYHRQMPKKQLRPLCFFILLSVISVTVQMLYPYLLIEIFFQSIGLLAILYSLDDKDKNGAG